MTKLTLSQDYLSLPSCFYSEVQPEPLLNPQLISLNHTLNAKLGISWEESTWLDLCSGQLNQVACKPVAQKYVGHQFGYYNPQLGDGRGLLLGQWQTPSRIGWDLHLKGAGRTPYSRSGDGRAVLRSSIREYLASEALAGLGVPTTRALALACGAEQVRRETFEPRATFIRATQTHIRFGHFQYAASVGSQELEALIHFVINKHFPEWQTLPLVEQASLLLTDICRKTALMIAKWQAVGFNHGVMNTDNFSILGETFDYGPFAFFDDFNSEYVCNHSDTEGRYGYDQQAKIGVWNCQVLAGSFADILSDAEIDAALTSYVNTYNKAYIQEMLRKLGLNDAFPTDKALVGDLVTLLNQQSIDYHQFFRQLGGMETPESDFYQLLPTPGDFNGWFASLKQRIQVEYQANFKAWQEIILANNPSVVLRSYIAQMIIEAAEKGDYEPLNHWLKALQNPFERHEDLIDYQCPPSAENKELVLSCSS